MKIVSPQGLAADAIVPQCLDNEFTTDKVLDRMLDLGKPFEDPEIARFRLEDSHAEFIRSLLYGSSVVVNRAYFINPGYVHQQLLEAETAIPELIRKKAVVPYLFTEHGLAEPAGFSQHSRGLTALKRLEDAGTLDEAECVRFSQDDQKNQEKVETLASRFRQFALDLGNLRDDTQFTRIAAGLYHAAEFGKNTADMAVPDDAVQDFSRFLGECSRFMVDKLETLREQKKRFGRQHIYEHFFIQDGDTVPENVHLGYFTPELRRPGLRMLKKLVDLKYNCNLPDLLGRYTLTPAELPGRSLLPYETQADAPDGDDLYEQIAGIKGSIMDEKPAILPRLRGLNLHQVLEIRELPEWQRFLDSQTAMLRGGPDGFSVSLVDYYDSLEKFQDRLALWSLSHAPDALERHRRFKTIVNIAVQIGVFTILVAATPEGATHALSGGNIAFEVAAGVGLEVGRDRLAKFLEQNKATEWIKGMSIKLMVKVFDSASNLVDNDHSYQLELIRSEKKMRLNEVIELVQDVQRASTVVRATMHLAEKA